ncbi:MAG: MgtC/SapB transporter [Fibrobacteria bacterium]|jgi:putative Mg2+ transporter-C (MgtC) family protein|nr:MgtC/SapB transporter [Fibrobacteria bacterium]
MTPVDDPNLLQVVLRLSAAAVVGLLLGLNRELKGKPAGLRTHALVSLGAALLALTSLHMPMGQNIGDPLSRVMQGVITGIGFLGAGVIIQGRSGNVKGLTTAAMVWVAAALGLACGAGYWVAVISTTILIFLVMMLEGLEKPLRQALGVKAPPSEGGESDGEGPDEGDAKARGARDRAF